MQYKKLDGLDVDLSCLGLGCLQLGGHGWGRVIESDMVKAVHQAIDSGITLFDTAPIYGLGHSEEVLGKVIGTKRKDVILATKVGLNWKTSSGFEKRTNGSPQNVMREIDLSLARLRTDYIDLYQIHWPDLSVPIEETLYAMEKLRQAGKVRLIGCCNFSLSQVRESLSYAKISTVQIPYSLVDRKAEAGFLPFCKEHNIAVLAYSPLARGLLSCKYSENTCFGPDDHRSRRSDEYFQGEGFLENLQMAKRVETVSRKLNRSNTQVALRWVLDNPCVASAIFGAKNAAQVEDNVLAADFILSHDDLELLNGSKVNQ